MNTDLKKLRKTFDTAAISAALEGTHLGHRLYTNIRTILFAISQPTPRYASTPAQLQQLFKHHDTKLHRAITVIKRGLPMIDGG